MTKMTMRTLLASAGCLLLATAATAQVLPPPQNVLQLQATGTVEVQQDLLQMSLSVARDGSDAAAVQSQQEVQQDLLQMSLSVARDGSDAAAVQSQLRSALEAALAEAKKTAQPGQMDVRTGNFAIYPRNNRDGRITGWTGSAELVLEGRDFPRISQAAARIQTMTLNGVSFGLSREQRARVEHDAQAQAIERFQARATELAKAFGFGGYALREVAVNTNEPGFVPRVRMMTAEAKAPSAEAVPVEPGRSAVTVTVSGSVQLR